MGGDVFFASTDSASPCFPLQPPSPHSVSRHGRHHNHAFFAPGCGGGGGPSRPAAAALRHAGGGPSRPAAALPPSPSAADAPARPHALPSVSFLAAKERRLAARDSASSRKRKQLSSDDDDESMCGDGSSAASPTSERPVSPVPTQDNSLLGAKRAKVEGARQTPLTKLLDTLDKAQLLNLIVTMAEQFPALRDYVDSQVPRPTLQGVQVLLQNLEKKLRDAFPYTKWGPLRDDYAFNRVKPLLLEIKDTVLTFSQHFAGPERFPTTAFPFLYEAANVAFRLPEWDKPQNNTIKFDLVAALLESYRLTVESTGAKTSAGKLFGMQVVDGWARDILSLIRTFSESAGAGEVAPAAAAGEAAAVGVGAERQACWRALLQIAREFGDNLGWMCSPSTLQQLRHAVDRDVSGG